MAVISRLCVCAVLGIGLAAIAGWALGERTLTSVTPALVPMTINAALSFACSGLALLLFQRAERRGALRAKAGGVALAGLVLLIAVTTIAEYLFDVNLWIDQFIIQEQVKEVFVPFPGRMAPYTAFNFLLLGIALLGRGGRKEQGRRLSRILARTVGAIALAAQIGYVYSLVSFGKFESYTGMAFLTSAAFLLLVTAILLDDPESEVVRALTSNSLGAVLEKRLLPAAVFVPFLVGWIGMEGQNAGLYNPALGIALFTTANIVIFFMLILWCARTLQVVDGERLEAQAALQKSSDMLSSMIRASPMPIIGIDNNEKVCIWNPAAERVFGWSEEELLGKDYPLVPPAQLLQYENTLRELKVRGAISSRETTRLAKDGKIVQVRASGAAFRDKNGNVLGWVGTLEDVTEQRQLQAQKMEAVGMLAGGIAHDFNNLLGVVIGSAEFLMSGVGAEEQSRKYVLEILKASERATTLVHQLLAFTRQQVLAPRIIVLNETVMRIHSLLQRLIGENIQLEARLAPDLGRVKVDPGQLEQVIMNLAVNSRDAMPQGGKLTIETQNLEIDEAYVRSHKDVRPGSYVMVAVSDTGTGMDAETQSHIFEPFFTTKETGRGTGLGLATVYGIVKQSGGHIWLYSEVGRGTTFKIYFPKTEETETVETQPRSGSSESSGTETILLVEDEDSLRELGAEILQQAGYRVIQARSGEEALALVEKGTVAIDLLMTDVIMPGVSGKGLAERLKPKFPHMRVLYVSGYTDDAISRHGVLEKGVQFLQKPYTRSALMQKIRGILDRVDAREVQSGHAETTEVN